MNLMDALRTGLPFRREDASEDVYYSPYEDSYRLSRIDILSDDWEVKEQKVEVTESSLRTAMIGSMSGSGYTINPDGDQFKRFLSLLGLKQYK